MEGDDIELEPIYERWMIEDGLPELAVGEDHEWFAIWFSSEAGLERSRYETKAVPPTEEFKYSVTAQLVFCSDRACVIDFGLKAIGSPATLPDGVAEGEYVSGEIQVGLEHWIWFCNILCVNCLGWIRLSVAGLGVKGARRATEAPQTMARR